MPGKVKVKIIAGRNLPVMDRGSDTTDAFVEIKLGSTSYKTDVCRKSLNPQWNSDWYRFEVEDSELQDEPLQIRIMDYDTYSANDAIGKVYLNLNPLLLPSKVVASYDQAVGTNCNHIKGGTISGWLPVYDTMHGIRGEVNIVVRLELFEDCNKFRQSSCGIHFYSSSALPEGFQMKTVHGFVEEMVCADDPEYQWIDKIRTPRSTNEARQTLFLKLSGEVKRKIGLQVFELGANSVVGYQQWLDLEGECGIVVRGIGTAVTLDPPSGTPAAEATRDTSSPLFRRSSDSDLNIIPKGNSLSINDKSSKPLVAGQRPPALETLDLGEYPFLTLSKYPPGFVQSLGGLVSARAVKLLGSEETGTRDSWWTELRLEVRVHARALGCNAVIAYSEHTTICEDVCIISASGTAAVISQKEYQLVSHLPFEAEGLCSVYHVPYNEMPFKVKLTKCLQCKNGKVGEVLLCTAELMDGAAIEGRGSLVQALVCRHKKDSKGELHAKEVSDSLPFLEYELYTQLIHRLSSIGANAVFGLRVELSIGERVLIGHATGTAIQLSALPTPTSPTENWEQDNSDFEEFADVIKELNLSAGTKETCVLEVGDASGGAVGIPPEGFFVSTAEGIPEAPRVGLTAVRNLQMFTQIWKAKMCPLPSSAHITAQVNRLLQGIYFKLRSMTPCALANIRFKVDLPQQDDIQISVVGMAVGLAEFMIPAKLLSKKPDQLTTAELCLIADDGDIIKNLSLKARRSIHTPPREQRYGVDVTPLSYIPGGRILCYLGNLNFFFIRESTCIRESGGLGAFVHGFVAEVLAIIRAHITAIGGNALVSYNMTQCYLTNNAHKNQAQCLISVGGDAVFVSYAEQ